MRKLPKNSITTVKKGLISFLSCFFVGTPLVFGLTIQEADHTFVPVEETITLTGEGFTGATAASFFGPGVV